MLFVITDGSFSIDSPVIQDCIVVEADSITDQIVQRGVDHFARRHNLCRYEVVINEDGDPHGGEEAFE